MDILGNLLQGALGGGVMGGLGGLAGAFTQSSGQPTAANPLDSILGGLLGKR